MSGKGRIRQTLAVSAVLVAVLFLLPLVSAVSFHWERKTPSDAPREEAEPFVSGVRDGAETLRVLKGDTVEEMDLGTYLVGVVRAEMPASFEPEALKAQAVAARTYTLYQLRSGGRHGDTADICTDPTCCQAYQEEAAARQGWGDAADEYEQKIESAVRDTDGEVILYDDAPILAVFHSASAGLTRPAGKVWSGDLPYLQAVASPEEGDAIPNYYSRTEFSLEEVRSRVLSALPEADLSGDAAEWLQNDVRDAAGSIETVEVGGVAVRGSRLRSILGLRSACFTWEVGEDTLIFFVTGYGHGVGMSQYGAQQMAREGSSYREILTHYYTGVTLGPWEGDGAE